MAPRRNLLARAMEDFQRHERSRRHLAVPNAPVLRLRQQVNCFETLDSGARYMFAFDELPQRVRWAIANSPFNICAACVPTETVRRRHAYDRPLHATLEEHFLITLFQLEEAVRQQPV